MTAGGEEPVFVRAPGLGLALVDLADGSVKGGYVLPSDLSPAEAAAAIAKLTVGNLSDHGPYDNTPHSDFIEFLVRELSKMGGQRKPRQYASQPAPNLPAAGWAGRSFTDPHSIPDASIDWNGIESKFPSLGLTLRRRGRDGGLLAGLGSVSVFEVLDLNQKVVAEGKGCSDEAARQSALGETVERLVAQQLSPGSLFISSADDLSRIGLRTPALAARSGDLFAPSTLGEWVSALTFDGVEGAMPAELAFYPFSPASGIKLFSHQHTSGLGAGASPAQASLAGLRECIETDCYWLSMRTRRLCGSFDLANLADDLISPIIHYLTEGGIEVHAGLINYDWPISVVHVVLETQSESLPALAHGLGSGSNHRQALQRALLEAMQVYSGLEKVCLSYWPEIAVGLKPTADPALVWAARSSIPRITAMFTNAPRLDPTGSFGAQPTDAAGLLNHIADRNMTAWRTSLGSMGGLHVERVLIDGAISPFSERDGPSKRLQTFLDASGLRDAYLDPILT